MKKVIGFSGKAGSGKTTAALHAISVFGGTKVALGDCVKEEVSKFLDSCLVPYEPRHLYGTAADKNEEFTVLLTDWIRTDYRPRRVLAPHMRVGAGFESVSLSYRNLLQLWGTEYRRAQDPDYWVKRAAEKIGKLEGLVFIDDIRFPSEAEMVRQMDGWLIRIDRPDRPMIDTPDHESEVALDFYTAGWDAWIGNNSTIGTFKHDVDWTLGYLEAHR